MKSVYPFLQPMLLKRVRISGRHIIRAAILLRLVMLFLSFSFSCSDIQSTNIFAPAHKAPPKEGEPKNSMTRSIGEHSPARGSPPKLGGGSTCYDWGDRNIPCDFMGQYGEFLRGIRSPIPRFIDNGNGTHTDHLTGLVWLKNASCFGLRTWKEAKMDAKGLKDGDCGPEPPGMLTDSSAAGDWRLPTMEELCTLIDFGERDPALPKGHKFFKVAPGYYWSSTRLTAHSKLVWVVYIDVGVVCYNISDDRAGHVLPVRGPYD